MNIKKPFCATKIRTLAKARVTALDRSRRARRQRAALRAAEGKKGRFGRIRVSNVFLYFRSSQFGLAYRAGLRFVVSSELSRCRQEGTETKGRKKTREGTLEHNVHHCYAKFAIVDTI